MPEEKTQPSWETDDNYAQAAQNAIRTKASFQASAAAGAAVVPWGRCCYNGLERTPYADEGVDLRLSGFVVPRHSSSSPACYHFQREQFRRYL